MTFFDLRFRSLLIQILILTFSVSGVSYAQQIERSWYHLTTGNGHGFQVFDLSAGRLTDFLEHPYRFVAPPDERRDGGIGRRDLAFDIYFGLTVGDDRRWLTNLADAAYEAESHIFKATTRVDDVDVVVRYFSPFGLEANAMIMVIELRNTGNSPVDVSAFAKANMKLGQGRPDPGGENEEIRWNGDYGVETGPGGGHVIYVPIGSEVQHDCGSDAAMFEQVRAGQPLQNRMGCDGNDQVLVTGSSSTIEPGQSFWWGQAILFVNDNPNEPQANDFRDDRTVADIWAAWTEFRAAQDPEGIGAEAIYTSALAEIEAWRVAPEELGLETLTPDEVKVWRQSETVLRMGQVMEPVQLNRRNRGMFLAALPIGEWHTGWVRDGAYAIVSQAMNGHVDEARWGIDFLLGAWAGFFSSDDYLGQDYRISSVRYYGNGKEEGDFNRFGPNVETDGFGLTLWAARAYLHYSCDQDWLNQETLHGDTVFEALIEIAEDIDEATENDLPLPECSIWEVHWDHRKVFTYTAATMIRGFYDFAAIAEFAGRDDLASYYRQRADDILEASKFFLINPRTNSFAAALEVAASDVYVDGSTVEMLHWGFVTPDDPIFQGTLQYYERLLTSAGGYRRLEERLSLNGEAQAGTYDLSEWVLLDLRIGEVFRMAGNEARADELLNKVTQSALANDLLIPELYLPDQYAVFTGVVPMVGYGAGAWQMAQLEKAGLGAPKADASWARCEQIDPDPMGGAGGSAGAGGEAGAGGSAGEMTGTGGAGGTPNDTGAGGAGGDVSTMPEPAAPLDPLAGDDSATFCATHSGGGQPIGLLILVLCLGLFRRSQSARAGAHHV